MKKDDCCRDSARFGLLGVLIAFYMLAGAAIFSWLERPAELQAHGLWSTRFKAFSEEHNISCEELHSLLHHYEEARTAGIRAQQSRALWEFPGSFYFVGTVVSTIGFGVSAPSTVIGKVLVVFYGLLGCSATVLFFNLFLERVITLLSVVILWCYNRKSRHSRLEDTDSRDGKNNWKPSIHLVTLILLVAVLLVACCAASVYSAMEGWTYLESLYFCFVAFSTVGFGDFVSGQREHHEETRGYQITNCLVMLLGVCCTYSLFNTISVIIKQGLNWLLKYIDSMCSGRRHFKFASFFRPCQHRHQVQTTQSSRPSIMWHICFPRQISKCFCSDAKVETVSRRDLDRDVSKQQVNYEKQNTPPHSN